MFRRTFKVVFRPTKHNFVTLPDNYYSMVSSYDRGCLSLTCGKYIFYTSWAAYTLSTVKDTEIGINAKVAKELGLKENDLVKCTLVADVMPLKTINVTPASPKDWEIIELSSEKVEEIVLSQVKIVSPAQSIVVWLNRSLQVTFFVDRIKPNISYGRLENNTELIVAPNLEKKVNFTNGNSVNSKDTVLRSKSTADISAVSTNLSRSQTTVLYSKTKSARGKSGLQDKFSRLIKDLKRENKPSFEFRVISGQWESSQISDVFVTRSNLPQFMDLEQIYSLKTNSDMEYYVNVKVITNSENLPNNIYPTIEINENLMKLLKLKELEKVSLQPKATILNFIEKIELFANRKTNYKIIEQEFKDYVLEGTKFFPLLFNQNQIVRLEDGLYVTLQIKPEHFKYCLINREILKECKIYAADEVKNVDVMDVEKSEEEISNEDDVIKIEKHEKIINKIIEQIRVNLCLDERNSVLHDGNFLISGPSNSGKSTIAKRILQEMSKKPYCCYYEIYYCTRSKGRKAESIQKDLRQIFTSCINNAPSVIVLENLDVLAHFVSNDQQTQDGEYFNRISDIIHQLIVEFTFNSPIVVIATVTDIHNVNSRLFSSRGRHLFHIHEEVLDLNRNDREQILRELCEHVENENLDFFKFSNLTEGYNVGDMVQFVERGIFYAYRLNQAAPVLTNDLLSKSLKNTNSYCLQGIENCNRNTTEENDHISVQDIPGLQNVVTVLEEVLMWPSKYPSIFNESPLRNQAGVLLFGPPGTGKTFLVSQIASCWNLRIISVKGPELLAKYIGQSEENVRSLFSRARNAKPCVLFFDEFDSLAPKRGHDSTGVTDRVVNQLLTELDGVEGLQGVTVIAATSRPELLDPALLRSGRIDRLVELSLPDCESRLNIFKILSKTLNLHESVDFKLFASKTQNYTGADIQSLLTTANMTAIKETIEKCGSENLPNKIYITQEHLLDAFNGTRPSLTALDIERYKQMYARVTNRERQPRDFVAKRATLA